MVIQNEHLEEHIELLHTAKCLGGAVSPKLHQGKALAEIGGDASEKFFCFYLQNLRKLVHRMNESLVLFCSRSATDMFAIHQMKNSSLIYVKHVLLDIAIKG